MKVRNSKIAMKATLKVKEITKNVSADLPDDIIPIKLEPVKEEAGGMPLGGSSTRFLLYYLERES